jgi:tetrahydromethanopterin S-methyltransferase subunit B
VVEEENISDYPARILIEENSEPFAGLSTAVIVGIVVGVIAFIAITAIILFFILRRREDPISKA